MPRLRTALPLGLVALAAWAVPANAASEAIFGPVIVGAPQLGVAADGQAVLAWSGSVTTFASIRPAGGGFGPRLTLSTGGNASRVFALGFGHGGDAVVVWQRTDRRGTPTGSLHASIRRSGRGFRRDVVVPGSNGARDPVAAVSPGGRILVAWRARARSGCGRLVMASVAETRHGFGPARRISGRCPHAARLVTAFGADERAIVAWRTGRARDAYELDAAVVGLGGVGIVRRVSHRPVVGYGAQIAGGDRGALLVWRDRLSGGPQGSRGAVATSVVTTRGTGAVVRVSSGLDVVGIPRVSMRPDGAGIIAWEEGISPARVFATLRPNGHTPFSAPRLVDACGAVDASRTYASAVRDLTGGAAVVFQSACMSRFGLGPDYGIALSRRPARSSWGDPTAVSRGAYSGSSQIGADDHGALVLAWVEGGVGLRVVIEG